MIWAKWNSTNRGQFFYAQASTLSGLLMFGCCIVRCGCNYLLTSLTQCWLRQSPSVTKLLWTQTFCSVSELFNLNTDCRSKNDSAYCISIMNKKFVRCVKSKRPINLLRPGKKAAIFQTFSNSFSQIKLYELRLRFHWTLLLWFESMFLPWLR